MKDNPMTTTPEAVDAALKFAEIRHLRLRNETFDEYLKAKKQLSPFLDAYEMETDCIRILAARVRELERELHPQPEQAKHDDEVLYGLDGEELLDDDLDDIVSRILENYSQRPKESFEVLADRIPWPVKVLEFRRMKVSDTAKNSLARSTLESLIEQLDEDHAGPDGNIANPTAPMQLAARRFVDEVVRHYKVWNCEPTGEVVEITREKAKEIVG